MRTIADDQYDAFMGNPDLASLRDQDQVLSILKKCITHYMSTESAAEQEKNRRAFINILHYARPKGLLEDKAEDKILHTIKAQFEKSAIDNLKGTNLLFMLDAAGLNIRLEVKKLYLDAQYKSFIDSYSRAFETDPPNAAIIKESLALIRNKDTVYNILEHCALKYLQSTNNKAEEDKNLSAFLLVLDHTNKNGLLAEAYPERLFGKIRQKESTYPAKVENLFEMRDYVLSPHAQEPTFRDLKVYIAAKEEELGLTGSGAFRRWAAQAWATLPIVGNAERKNKIQNLRNLKKAEKRLKKAKTEDGYILVVDDLPKHENIFDDMQQAMSEKRMNEIILRAQTSKPKQTRSHTSFTPSTGVARAPSRTALGR